MWIFLFGCNDQCQNSTPDWSHETFPFLPEKLADDSDSDKEVVLKVYHTIWIATFCSPKKSFKKNCLGMTLLSSTLKDLIIVPWIFPLGRLKFLGEYFVPWEIFCPPRKLEFFSCAWTIHMQHTVFASHPGIWCDVALPKMACFQNIWSTRHTKLSSMRLLLSNTFVKGWLSWEKPKPSRYSTSHTISYSVTGVSGRRIKGFFVLFLTQLLVSGTFGHCVCNFLQEV